MRLKPAPEILFAQRLHSRIRTVAVIIRIDAFEQSVWLLIRLRQVAGYTVGFGAIGLDGFFNMIGSMLTRFLNTSLAMDALISLP